MNNREQINRLKELGRNKDVFTETEFIANSLLLKELKAVVLNPGYGGHKESDTTEQLNNNSTPNMHTCISI